MPFKKKLSPHYLIGDHPAWISDDEAAEIQSALNRWNSNCTIGGVTAVPVIESELVQDLIDIKRESRLHWLKLGDVLAHIAQYAIMLSGYKPWEFPQLSDIVCSKTNWDQAIKETGVPIEAALAESNMTKEDAQKVVNHILHGISIYRPKEMPVPLFPQIKD